MYIYIYIYQNTLTQKPVPRPLSLVCPYRIQAPTIYMHTHTHAHTRIHTHTQTLIHTQTHTHTHIDVYIHMISSGMSALPYKFHNNYFVYTKHRPHRGAVHVCWVCVGVGVYAVRVCVSMCVGVCEYVSLSVYVRRCLCEKDRLSLFLALNLCLTPPLSQARLCLFLCFRICVVVGATCSFYLCRSLVLARADPPTLTLALAHSLALPQSLSAGANVLFFSPSN